MATIIRGLNSPALQVIQEANRVARKLRYPIHNHVIQYKPLQIRPFLIAPVLPGETMANLNMQARVITDPLAPKLGNILPWWSEHYFYYVKARQIVKDDFEAMMLQGTSLPQDDGANAVTYHNGGTIDWVKRCLDFVVENGGFRNEGEAASAALIDGVPAAAGVRHRSNWLDSLMAAQNLDPDNDTTPVNSELQHPHSLGHVMPEIFEQYERMRAMQLIDMTFEDWLNTYGVSLPDQALLEKPELIRMVSEWSYPTNTVDPTSGAPTGAAVFSHNIRADKDRFFNEPGFIFGVTLIRPKVFMANQTGSAIQLMDSAYSWMPRMLADQPHISVRGFIGGDGADPMDPDPTGPLRGQTLGYWVDMRDLFTYGDQFISLAEDSGYVPAIPTATGEKRYLTENMVDALFADGEGDHVFARQDGVTRLSIKGHPTTAQDMT